MRPTYTFLRSRQFQLATLVTMLVIAGCSLEKKSTLNRGLQNLTAKYNILFNANELLREKQESYASAYVDDYNELLSVYRDTAARSTTPDKDLEAVKVKANNIINLKEQSHYIGDGYLLLGKANYYQGNFFDAAEYFSYVTRSFAGNADLKQEASVWQARALLYLKRNTEAKLLLDSALLSISPKKKITADVYAARLQYGINTQNYAEAEEIARQAVSFSRSKQEELRWTFILAQLQELNLKPADAIASYSRIANSNAAFSMAFNANLNRIRIEDNRDGVKISRIARLQSLLKNSNNKEFTDQVYYQIAELQFAGGETDNAVKSYQRSVRFSQVNQTQKGLSYLRLADIHFKNKRDYIAAKNYYDSTLLNLSANYPGYLTIKKKSDNLDLLADRLDIISREDTLQMLAALDEPARDKRIDEMVDRNTLRQQAVAVTTANAALNPFNNADPADPQASTPTGGSFYFYNNNAISQGFTDFKRVWGNRKLEDNWRRSNKAGADINAANNNPNIAQSTDPDALPNPLPGAPDKIDASSFRQDIVQNLPLSPELLAQSNLRVYNAYTDIANFYRDVLQDKKEAITAYEAILARFPGNPNTASVYYNLYRLYSESNIALSDKYKGILLKDYAQTPFAKTILDPDYGKRLSDEDTGFSNLYNKVYDMYAGKQYQQVIAAADDLLQRYPSNRYAAQLYYLRAFAAGHQEKLAPFLTDLQLIITKYPNDQLITPLVNQHLNYININQAELAARNVVLTDKSDTEFTIPIVYQQKTEYRAAFAGRPDVIADVRKPENKPADAPLTTSRPVAAQPSAQVKTDLPQAARPAVKPAAVPVKEAPSIFSDRDSTNYYFVVNVSTGTTNLASSRFGIGQFNRVNFEGNAIKHQLRNAGPDNQLIYVGRFYNLNNVKDYARAIIPLMPDIMKVPKDKYSFFIITQENLDKLADKNLLDSYMDYYQKKF